MTEIEVASDMADRAPALSIGRYLLHRQIARGGMATIHIARLMGDEGFSRIVAAKRLLPEFAEDAEFVAMFLGEARVASRIHHRNIVPVLDVVTTGGEVVLVQEYVHGAPLHWLLNKARQTKSHVPVAVAVSIACQVLAGLHAAHESVDEMGAPLDIVHRDVSPQNVMIAADGTARLLDFGVAKSLMAAHVTREGTYKGKLAYSAPEQLRGAAVRQSDIYSLTVLLWELLVGHRMHRTAQAEAELVATIMNGKLPTVTEALAAEREWEAIDDEHWKKLEQLEPILKRGLAVDVRDRFQTGAEMEEALFAVVRPASSSVVAQWLRGLGKEYLDKHEKVLAAEEASWRRAGGVAQGSVRRQIHTATGEPPRAARGTRMGSIPSPDDGSSIRTAHTLTSAPQYRPQEPSLTTAAVHQRAPYALVALLSLLVVALAVGIIIVVTSSTEPPAPAAAASTPPPAAPAPVVTPAPEPAPAARPAPRAQPAPAAATVERTEEGRDEQPAAALSIGEVETSASPSPSASSAPSAPVVRRIPVVRPPPPRQQTRTQPPPPARTQQTAPAAAVSGSGSSGGSDAAPATPPPETRAAPAKDKDNCTPPYYFDGNKKIFKPACL